MIEWVHMSLFVFTPEELSFIPARHSTAFVCPLSIASYILAEFCGGVAVSRHDPQETQSCHQNDFYYQIRAPKYCRRAAASLSAKDRFLYYLCLQLDGASNHIAKVAIAIHDGRDWPVCSLHLYLYAWGGNGETTSRLSSEVTHGL